MALLRTVHSNVLCGTPNNVFVELTHFRSFILKSVFITLNKFKFSVSSHHVPLQMAIIFNTEDLKDVKPPCVLQSFINHNAVLYKVRGGRVAHCGGETITQELPLWAVW